MLVTCYYKHIHSPCSCAWTQTHTLTDVGLLHKTERQMEQLWLRRRQECSSASALRHLYHKYQSQWSTRACILHNSVHTPYLSWLLLRDLVCLCVLILSVLADSAADGIVLPACADKAQSGQLPLLVFWQEERGGGEGGGGGGGGCLCCNSEISRFPASTQHALVDQTKPRFSSTYKMRSLIQRCPPAALSAVGVERHPGCVAALLEHLPLCSAKLFSFTAHELQLFYLTPSGVQSRFDLWLRITDSSLWSCSIFNRNNERDFSSTWQMKIQWHAEQSHRVGEDLTRVSFLHKLWFPSGRSFTQVWWLDRELSHWLLLSSLISLQACWMDFCSSPWPSIFHASAQQTILHP